MRWGLVSEVVSDISANRLTLSRHAGPDPASSSISNSSILSVSDILFKMKVETGNEMYRWPDRAGIVKT